MVGIISKFYLYKYSTLYQNIIRYLYSFNIKKNNRVVNEIFYKSRIEKNVTINLQS